MAETTKGSVLIEVGAGELIDKITILHIKAKHMTDPAKLHNVKHELHVLSHARSENLAASAELDRLEDELREVNEALWVIEDDIRACEAERDFSQTFIDLARAVYIQNDRRATLKKSINALCGSSIVEEKSYTEF
ncbi:MAG: DUF6165 family protein [Thiobacillaceae bacterium]